MNDVNIPDQLEDFAEQKDRLKTLRTLTVLTFIGCGIAYIFILAMPAINDWTLDMLNKAASSGKELSDKQLADIDKSKAAILLSKSKAVPLTVISLVATTMCLFGAIWMRKLKKDGFWIYAVGEILPLLAGFFLMGTAQFNGAVSIVIAVAIPVVFVILYAMQRKHLIY